MTKHSVSDCHFEPVEKSFLPSSDEEGGFAKGKLGRRENVSVISTLNKAIRRIYLSLSTSSFVSLIESNPEWITLVSFHNDDEVRRS